MGREFWDSGFGGGIIGLAGISAFGLVLVFIAITILSSGDWKNNESFGKMPPLSPLIEANQYVDRNSPEVIINRVRMIQALDEPEGLKPDDGAKAIAWAEEYVRRLSSQEER